MSNSNEVRLREVHGVGAKRFSDIMNVLTETNESLDTLVNMPAQKIKERFKLPRNIAEAIELAFKVTPEAFEAELLASKGISVFHRGMEGYPERLERTLGEEFANNPVCLG